MQKLLVDINKEGLFLSISLYQSLSYIDSGVTGYVSSASQDKNSGFTGMPDYSKYISLETSDFPYIVPYDGWLSLDIGAKRQDSALAVNGIPILGAYSYHGASEIDLIPVSKGDILEIVSLSSGYGDYGGKTIIRGEKNDAAFYSIKLFQCK